MRAGPPSPKGFIVTGRKEIRDFQTGQSRDMQASRKGKHD